jgi:hypothetical protein
VNKPRQQSIGRPLCVAVVAIVLLLPAAYAVANPETTPVRVTFVDPIAINEVNGLEFGFIDQNLANLESVIIAPDSTVSDPAERVEGGPQAAASLIVSATPGRAIIIVVDTVVSGAGYSLADFRCNYDAGSDTACDGAGYATTSVASGNLLVGVTLTGDGTAVVGAAAGSFDVTVTYQ